MRSKYYALLLLGTTLATLSFATAKPNVLFIGIDDMRPELGCYGSIAVTPNMDALSADGLQFNRAYVQQPICGPSRASLMTGMRPDSSGVTHNYLEFRDLQPDVVTLPQYFREQGYETAYCGKIFHGKKKDEQHSWSRKSADVKLPKPVGFALPENRLIQQQMRKEMFAKYGEQAKYGLASGPAYECADVPDKTYMDGYQTRKAIKTMQEMAQGDKPFFMALGFKLPHLNWVAPKRYWDLYNRDEIPLAEHTDAPIDGSPMGLHPGFELRVRHGIPKDGPIGEDLARTLKHAYLACASYVDAQIGLMVEALEEAGVRDNTIIIVWSDHGWHLGELGTWGKATNYEIATRIPMILWTPDMPDANRGVKTEALVELIDMYPTLCDLANIGQPEHLEGFSMKALLQDPEQPWKSAVFSQFPTPALREWGSIALRPGMRETYFGPLIEKQEADIQAAHEWDREFFEQDVTGYAMRTDRYRIVAWKDKNDLSKESIEIELYDHQNDPNETKNIAKQHPEIVRTLLTQLDSNWRAALPIEKEHIY